MHDKIVPPLKIYMLSKEELDAEIEKGFKDMITEQVRPVEKIFDEIRKDYKL